MLDALAQLGPKYVVLTGVSFEEGKIGIKNVVGEF